jgi:low temperature requirement protein LtrA
MFGRHVTFEKTGQFFVKFTNIKFYQNLFYLYQFKMKKKKEKFGICQQVDNFRKRDNIFIVF